MTWFARSDTIVMRYRRCCTARSVLLPVRPAGGT